MAEWASQGAHELKIQASSAILCTCKASGQKGGKQGIGTREKPPFLSRPTSSCHTATSCCSLKAAAAQLPQGGDAGRRICSLVLLSCCLASFSSCGPLHSSSRTEENRHLKWARGTQCGPEPADFAVFTCTTVIKCLQVYIWKIQRHLTGHVRRNIGDQRKGWRREVTASPGYAAWSKYLLSQGKGRRVYHRVCFVKQLLLRETEN